MQKDGWGGNDSIGIKQLLNKLEQHMDDKCARNWHSSLGYKIQAPINLRTDRKGGTKTRRNKDSTK